MKVRLTLKRFTVDIVLDDEFEDEAGLLSELINAETVAELISEYVESFYTVVVKSDAPMDDRLATRRGRL